MPIRGVRGRRGRRFGGAEKIIVLLGLLFLNLFVERHLLPDHLQFQQPLTIFSFVNPKHIAIYLQSPVEVRYTFLPQLPKVLPTWQKSPIQPSRVMETDFPISDSNGSHALGPFITMFCQLLKFVKIRV